jgi:hypothetical protein
MLLSLIAFLASEAILLNSLSSKSLLDFIVSIKPFLALSNEFILPLESLDSSFKLL